MDLYAGERGGGHGWRGDEDNGQTVAFRARGGPILQKQLGGSGRVEDREEEDRVR